MVFDLDADPAESTPLDILTDEDAIKALAEAELLLRHFENNLEDGLKSTTDFGHGSHPDAWPCCNPDNLSCRCDDNEVRTKQQYTLTCS